VVNPWWLAPPPDAFTRAVEVAHVGIGVRSNVGTS
jgi:hypothetical protein